MESSLPPLCFFNTETRKKEVFTPLENAHVKMYTCGPTVYNFAHIGNFRTYIFEDVLRRTLKFFGYQVTQVMNLTDVDDKTIRGATEANLSLDDYVQPYKNAFFVDLQTLNIERVECYPAATQYIPHMIDFIQTLLDKGFAYKSNDQSIYFSIDKFPRYGRLSQLKLGELKVGAGDAHSLCDEYDKENMGDFVLWKAYDSHRDGPFFWESPFGPGRPGWHLECSTMAIEILGEALDIHVGGVDNIFPHHENEIAQSEACSGTTFARYWLHCEHLLVGHKKMSKSLGNFYTLRDLIDKGYSGREVRYMLMQVHYRTPLNFTFEGMDAAKNTLQRLQDFCVRLQEKVRGEGETHPAGEQTRALVEGVAQQFREAMADDLNISVALAALFELMRQVNVWEQEGRLGVHDARAVLLVLEDFNRVLGILSFEEEGIAPEWQRLLEEREKARKEKNWALSDSLRQRIQEGGFLIEDTPQGPRLKKKG